MKTLIINFKENFDSSINQICHFSYNIGSTASSPAIKSLNNSEELTSIALNLRDKFSDFTYSINSYFIRHRLLFKNDLSLFFLSDVSCKRTEFLPLFNYICNVIQIDRIINDHKISCCILSGAPESFRLMFKSKIKIQTQYIDCCNSSENVSNFNLLKSSLFFYIKYFIINFIYLFYNTQPKSFTKNIYFSRFPLHFKSSNFKVDDKFSVDQKYGTYILDFFSDGFLQKLNFKDYFKNLFIAKRIKNAVLLDSLSSFSVTATSLYYFFKFYILNINFSLPSLKFKGIEVSSVVHYDLKLSSFKISRYFYFLILFDNVFKNLSHSNFHYILHEYPFGRIISYVASKHKNIKSVGYQHGLSSWTKLVYFTSKHEQSINNIDPRLNFPIPNKVVCDDEDSLIIYKSNGYRNIEIQSSNPRLHYLSKIKPFPNRSKILVVAGLHDADMLYRYVIAHYSDKLSSIVFKIHPRSKFVPPENTQFKFTKNIPIYELLKKAKLVLLTYSFVKEECSFLGIDYKVVHIPGIIEQ